MNNRGRIACCGAISQYDGVPSAHGPRGVPGLIVVKRLIMQGFIVMDYMDERDAALTELQSWVASGKLKVQEDVIDGLENTPKRADRPARRREPRQADGEGVGRTLCSSSSRIALRLSGTTGMGSYRPATVDTLGACEIVCGSGRFFASAPSASSQSAGSRRRTSERTARRDTSKPDHAGEHRDADRLAGVGAGACRQHQRHHAEDEGE